MPAPIPADLRFEVEKGRHLIAAFGIQMSAKSDVQDILNECYFTLKQHGIFVGAYMYNRQWVILDKTTRVRVESDGTCDERPAIEHFDAARHYAINILDAKIAPELPLDK